jgi:hypothetical protein
MRVVLEDIVNNERKHEHLTLHSAIVKASTFAPRVVEFHPLHWDMRRVTKGSSLGLDQYMWGLK